MNIVVTGSSGGIGRAVCERFLSLGHTVYGLDLSPAALDHARYHHYQTDIREASSLPDVPGVGVLFNNAGAQNSGDDIGHNLRGAIHVTEKYICGNTALRSVLFNASASAVSGQEFPEYAAAKAGLLGYMKNVAIRVAPLGATCNALSLGGVYTPLNDPVVNDPESWRQIMDVTPLKKWMSTEEVADWVIFLTLTNRSMSGQNLLIDNGEHDLIPRFVWPDTDGNPFI